jgi:hypothetical protein
VGVLVQWKEFRIGERLLSFGKGVGWFLLATLVLGLVFNSIDAAIKAMQKSSSAKKRDREDKKSGAGV